MTSATKTTGARRFLGFFIASALLFFLAYSAPHRVHHSFEKAAESQEHDSNQHEHSDRQNPPVNEPPCVFQSVAAGCHLRFIAQITFSSLQIFTEKTTARRCSIPPYHLAITAFAIRAPPLA
jgi:hypothetical protein